MLDKIRANTYWILLVAIMLIFVAGCTSEKNTVIPEASTAAANGVLAYKEILLTKQDVIKALEENEVKMTADSSSSYFELNKVKPSIFTLPDNEKIMVYVYDSNKGTQQARHDFAEHTMLMDMNAPLIYKIKNVLILYHHQASNSTPEDKTAYHAKIEKTIGQLLGDEIYVGHGNRYNSAKLENFVASFANQQADQLKITAITDEGDPIYTYLVTDGTILQYAYDNSEDAFAGSDKGVSKTQCTAIEKQRNEVGNTVYTVTGCQNENERYLMAVPN